MGPVISDVLRARLPRCLGRSPYLALVPLMSTHSHVQRARCFLQDNVFLEAKNAVLPAVFQAICRDWEANFSAYTSADVEIGDRVVKTYASWLRVLRRARWLRSSQGMWYRPDELYADTREVHRLQCFAVCNVAPRSASELCSGGGR